MIKQFSSYALILALALALSSCDTNRVYEKNEDIAQQKWMSTDSLHFDFEISDHAPKNLYLNFRHRFGFNWRNVWINLALQFPNDSVFIMPVNMPLSQPDGQWYGDCSGDVCLMQYPLHDFTAYSFLDTGNYRIALNHDMREDPLLEVLSVGVRVEEYVKAAD